MAKPRKADRRLLDDGRRTREMLWVMAIMIFLTVLAGALGLGMARAGQGLDRQLAGRLTVQIVATSDAGRDRDTRRMVAALRALPDVAHVAEVDRAKLAELLQPWLGEAGVDAELPIPALVDVDLRQGDDAAVARVVAAARATVATAEVDRHADWLAPVRGFITTLTWLAGALVLLMAVATGAVVLLAARSGLDTHRDTIDVLHMLGSTDIQVARLFQRRIALDTLVGGLIGTVAAAAVVGIIGYEASGLGSELLGGVALAQVDWAILVSIPLLFALLATVAARVTVLRALGETL